MAEPEFADLLAGAKRGDETCFAAVWRRLNPPLVRFLVSLAGRDEAADIAATTWLEVVRHIDRFEGDERGFKAWLFTVARNRLIDLRRAQARRPLLAVPPEDLADRAAHRADPADIVAAQYSTGAAIELIGTLPHDQAEVVLLRVLAELDVAEVARITGKREGTVRVLCHRGLRRLAAELQPSAMPSGVTP